MCFIFRVDWTFEMFKGLLVRRHDDCLYEQGKRRKKIR